MKKPLLLHLFFYFTIAVLLGGIVLWRYCPLSCLADVLDKVPTISATTKNIIGAGKGSKLQVPLAVKKKLHRHSPTLSNLPNNREHHSVSEGFQENEFYRTIIDNNLFRPLGWTRPRPKPIYRLSGTVIPTDGNKPRYAIVQTTRKNKTHIVTIGEKLDTNITVTDIEPRIVILDKAGQQITLKLEISPWLNTKGSRTHRR